MDALPFRLGYNEGSISSSEMEASMRDVIGSSVQLSALQDANLVASLGLAPNTTVIKHNEPMNAKAADKVKTRHATSGSSCYSELILARHWVVEDLVWGDRFISYFLFRDFRSGLTAQLTIKGQGGNKLKGLTNKQVDVPADATQHVAEAIRGNFAEFARMARPKIAAKRASKA